MGEEIRHILAGLFLRGDFHDAELMNLSITITEVRISPDLKNATAYFMTLGGGGLENARVILNRTAPFFRSQLAKALSLRYTPQLVFAIDETFAEADKMDKIFRALKPSGDPIA